MVSRIFRMETSDRTKGFFATRGRTGFHFIAKKHDTRPPEWGSDKYPSTDEEFTNDRPHNWAHGCNSWREFRRWFPENLDPALEEAGYVISLFEVDDEHCLHGRTQSLFDYDKARLLLSVKPSEQEKLHECRR